MIQLKCYFYITCMINIATGGTMRFFKELYQDYLESRFSHYESFLEWFLKRKLSFWGKMLVAGLLWAFWLFMISNLIHMVYLFYCVCLVAVIVIVIEIYTILTNKER